MTRYRNTATKNDASLRALGLVDGSFSTPDYVVDYLTNGIVGVYSPARKAVFVNAAALSSADLASLDRNAESVLVHELTHALDHQVFGRRQGPSPGAATAVRSLNEGDAERIEGSYKSGTEGWQPSFPDPVSSDGGGRLMREFAAAPYVLGPLFVDRLARAGGEAAVDQAFRRPPRAEADLIVPGRYERAVKPARVSGSVPRGAAKRRDGGTFGMVSALLLLGERVGYREARNAVTGWSGDRVTYFTLGGRECARITTKLDSADAVTRFAAAVSHWVSVGPRGAAIVVRTGPRDVVFDACDPGKDYRKPSMRGMSPFDLLAAEVTVSAVRGAAVASCLVDGLAADATVRRLYRVTMTKQNVSALRRAITAIADRCSQK